MLSKEEVNHIAKLARLSLSREEVDKLQAELSSILDYIEKLKEVNVEGVEPTSHSILVENVLREDKIKKEEIETKNSLKKQAPDSDNDFIKVKSVL